MAARAETKAGVGRRTDQLMTPEGVPLGFEIAGVGARIAAQLTDILLTTIGAIAFLLLLMRAEVVGPEVLSAVFSLLFFFIRIPYYVLSELAWNGQTIGKRLMQIKVVSNDGGPLTTHALVTRNLMKEAEIFLPGTLIFTLDTANLAASLAAFAWVVGTLLVPLLTKRHRRLGDLIAGTYVIHLPVPVLLADLATHSRLPSVGREPFSFLSHHLDHYGAYELQTLERILRARDKNLTGAPARSRAETEAKVVEAIRNKIGYADPVPQSDHLRFLRAFYNAQRAHLEQRRLFGDARADKHHAAQGAGQDAGRDVGP